MEPYVITHSFIFNKKISRYLPGGEHSNFFHDTSNRLHFRQIRGSRCVDLDGNEYVDLYNGSGSVFLGYGYPDFISSLRHCIDQNLIPRQSELEWETAQYLAEAIPCCEQVRFGLSGTEMVTNALRLARAFTGREIIIRFQGHYHGSSDSMLPNNIKNRTSQNSTVIELPWNDADKLESCLRNYPVAAIIMEPICINGWGIEPLAGYLEKTRELCNRFGSLLIFDEIITGVRTGLGGIQKNTSVTPDLSLFGKSIGNGIPITVLVGKRSIMSLYEKRQLVHGGTFNGHVLGLAAIRSTFSCLARQPQAYTALEEKVERLQTIILHAANECNLEMVIQGGPNCLVLNCSKTPIRHYDECTKRIQRNNHLIRQYLRRTGILTAPLLRLYPNMMLDNDDLIFMEQRFLTAFRNARRCIDYLDRDKHAF